MKDDMMMFLSMLLLCCVFGQSTRLVCDKIEKLTKEVSSVSSEIRLLTAQGSWLVAHYAKPQVPLLESPTAEEALSGKGEPK